jgi:site-specific recombinase XerD
LAVPDRERLVGKRDHAILALLLGCCLRRQELAHLKVEEIVEREGRSVIVDLVGKGRRVRTVVVPYGVKQSIEQWTTAAGLEIGQGGRNCTRGLVSMVGGRKLCQGNRNQGFRSHDLRCTCAKLCRKSGGDLEQITFLLGHSSIQTTERFLGCEQEIAVAVNDRWSL